MMAIPFGGVAGNPDLPVYLPSESLPYAKIPGSRIHPRAADSRFANHKINMELKERHCRIIL